MTILYLRSCAPLPYEKSIIEGAVHRIFRGTSIWNKFDGTMKVSRKHWMEKQTREIWTDKIVSKTLENLIKGKVKKSLVRTHIKGILIIQTHHPGWWCSTEEIKSLIFTNKVRNLIKANIVFNTRNILSPILRVN